MLNSVLFIIFKDNQIKMLSFTMFDLQYKIVCIFNYFVVEVTISFKFFCETKY